MVEYIDYDTYCREALRTKNTHWTAPAISFKERWPYHQEAIEILKGLDIQHPSEVLEIGSLGASVVLGSDTLDYDNAEFRVHGYSYQPTIKHDLRQIPWPIETGKYKALVALRVWHHLKPVEHKALIEARRVAENVIIVCPEANVRGRGITREQFTEWGGPPRHFSDVVMGPLYWWNGGKT